MKISQTVFELQSGHDFVTDGQTDGQTDRRTDGQMSRAKTICLPTLNGGDINSNIQRNIKKIVHLIQEFYLK